MTKQWVINILGYILNVLELETVEWLFDEEKHPTLAAVEDRYFTYISNMIQRLQAYRTKGGKMDERTPVCHAESSVTERMVIAMQLEDMASAVEHLDQMPIREALDTLDGVIECCEYTLTNLENLKVWANQPTEGVNIPF